MIKFGRFKITLHNFGYFRLDGGSMFGSVPKNIWSKSIAPDPENCIALSTRCLLIEDGSRTFLVDVGMGEKWPDKLKQIYAIKNTPRENLAINFEAVTDIIITHLHFDHAGGISRYKAGSSSEVELCFPNAKIYLQESNWNNARNPNLKERASYLKENVFVLESATVKLLQGSSEIYPDIWAHQIDGHTKGQQWLEIINGKESLVYPTDLIPTSHHLPVPFHMGYDICADTLLREKETFLKHCVERNSIVVFEHDPKIEACRVGVDERGHFCVKEIVQVDS